MLSLWLAYSRTTLVWQAAWLRAMAFTLPVTERQEESSNPCRRPGCEAALLRGRNGREYWRCSRCGLAGIGWDLAQRALPSTLAQPAVCGSPS